MPEQAKRVYTSNPILTFSGVDNLGDINAILNVLEMGVFRQAAILVDAMMRDDRIKAVLETRIGALRACPLVVKPASHRQKAGKIAKLLGGEDEDPGEWDKMFTAGAIGDLSLWGTMLNLGVAELIWSRVDGIWWPRLKTWHPQFVRWSYFDNRYLVETTEGQVPLPPIDEQPMSDGKWVVWCPRGYQYGWLKGLVRPMAPKYVNRQWVIRDWGRYNELHGQGIMKAIVPVEHGEDEKGIAFRDYVANRGAEATILVPKGEEGNQYDVELVEAESKTWDSFEASKKSLDTDIAIMALGQNLTTESGTDGGSHAAAKVADVIRLNILRDDARLAACLRDQVLTWFCRFNFGDPKLAPRPIFDTEPPTDQLAEATALKTTGDAITSLRASSDRVDDVAILEARGVPLLSEEEAAARKAVEAEERAAAAPPPVPGAGGPGSPPPGGQRPQPPRGRPGQPPAEALRSPMPAALQHRTFAGMPVVIENQAGSIRLWRDEAANVIGSTKMLHDYGYLEGVEGSDGEELDVYLGPDENAPDVHVVHQLARPDYKRHDEDKVMLGFPSGDAARAAYVAHRNDGDRAIGGMSSMPIDRFKAKLRTRTGTGRIRASAAIDATSAIMLMLERGRAHAATLKSGPARRRYTDELTDKAGRLAARSLAADLALLKVEIGKAETFADLRKRIVAAYRDKMHPAELARIVQKTRLMAHLAGAASVHKERSA